MKRLSLLSFLVAVLAVPVFAQSTSAPVVTTIQPVSGPAEGGTTVTITGANLSLPNGFACILPCPSSVLFDGLQSTLVDERNESLTVKTPAHVPGRVDVEIRTGDGRSLVLPGIFTYTSTNNPGYEMLLLPVYLDGTVAGAHGSRWKSEFWIHNAGGESVQIAPMDCGINQICPAVFPPTRTLVAAESLRNLTANFRPPSANVGRLLYVSNHGAKNVSTSLRLWDESRQNLDAGAEIPVVRQNEFLSGQARLVAVPLDGNFRLALRIYEMNLTQAKFHVRVYEQFEGVGAQVPMTQFDVDATTTETGTFRSTPAYGEYNRITDLLLNPVPRPPLLRVEISPLNQGSVFWAFIAVTNNETQRVSIVTPQ